MKVNKLQDEEKLLNIAKEIASLESTLKLEERIDYLEDKIQCIDNFLDNSYNYGGMNPKYENLKEEIKKLHQIIDQNTTSFNQRISGLEMRAANDSSDGIKANFDYLNRNLTTYLINKTDEIYSECNHKINTIKDRSNENKIEIDFLKTKRKEYRHKTNKRIHDLELKVDFMIKVFEERLSPLETITKIYHESTQDDGKDCKDLDLNQLRKMFYILSKLVANVQNKVYKLEGHCFGLSLDQAKQLEENIQNNKIEEITIANYYSIDTLSIEMRNLLERIANIENILIDSGLESKYIDNKIKNNEDK